jgi:hypothetical protein
MSRPRRARALARLLPLRSAATTAIGDRSGRRCATSMLCMSASSGLGFNGACDGSRESEALWTGVHWRREGEGQVAKGLHLEGEEAGTGTEQREGEEARK